MMLRRTQYWNLSGPNPTPISGPAARAESRTDVEEYLLPFDQARTLGLQTWGVSAGLQVSAPDGADALKISTGTAVDARGRVVTLAAGGLAVVDPSVGAVGVQNIPTVAVGPDGVQLDTAPHLGALLLTLTWREVEEVEAGLLVLAHAPWLRLVPVDGFTDDGQQLVLAGLTVEPGGLVGNLVPGSRRLAGTPSGRIELRAPASVPGAGVGQVQVATLAAAAGGDLVLALPGEPAPVQALTIAAGTGDTRLAGALKVPSALTVGGDTTVAGTLTVAAGDGSEGTGFDVFHRMRVRANGPFSAGVWFHEDADRAFVGMGDTTHVGFFGANGAGWGLAMSTASGNVGLGLGLTEPSARLDVGGHIAVRARGDVNHGIPGFLRPGVGIDASGNIGIRATGTPWAGTFDGDVQVTGTLSKGGGGFTIDHPLEPAEKFLSHSFVESSEMLNVYTGTAVTDVDGLAWVELPEYFEALNRDLTYQLTAVGLQARLTVAEEVADNRFAIRSEPGEVKVCWLVTGVRQDMWAEAHRIVTERAKPDEAVGRYLHPSLFGVSPDRSLLDYRRPTTDDAEE
ncbi:hypothetical protein OG558_32440 [Kribbella sp. NBC_01510]|uniref:hypothetical protein n=1 Tax=Kribbella sp. NBC_01510 TaxID=2903581 RepID=UPI003870617B